MSTTGISGLNLGGGVGWAVIKYCMTIGNPITTEVVTASGEKIRANETESQDLFWGHVGVAVTLVF